jgi:hypothetical protein
MKHCAALELVAKKHGYDSWRACCAVIGNSPQVPNKTQVQLPEMKHYESVEWNFALDIPMRWNSFPAVSANSPYEVIRFASYEDGKHMLIIFRMPHDPKKSLKDVSDQVQQVLIKGGYGNFSNAETRIGSRAVITLDFDKLQGDVKFNCRHYFLAEGTLGYTLGFGTSNRAGMFETFDHMAKTFEILGESPPPQSVIFPPGAPEKDR